VGAGGIAVNPNGTVNIAGATIRTGTLTMNGGSANINIGPVLKLGGANRQFSGVTINDAGNLVQSGTSIAMDGGNITINGTNGVHNLPMHAINASNSSTILLNPGAGNTLTHPIAGTINLNKSIIRAQSGLFDY